MKMIEDIVRSADIQLRAKESFITGRKTPQAQHKEILAACIERDVKKATKLLQEHLEHTQKVLLEERDPALLL